MLSNADFMFVVDGAQVRALDSNARRSAPHRKATGKIPRSDLDVVDNQLGM